MSLVCTSAGAQTRDDAATNIIADTAKDGVCTPEESFLSAETADTIQPSVCLPPLNRYGLTRIGSCPIDFWGMYDWELHKGMNVSLGASVFAAFGKHAPKGAGFGQNVSLMYAIPLTDKLSFAAGGYFSNMYWSSYSYRDAGLCAMLGYRFDEHWEAYIYGQKAMTNSKAPTPLFDMGNIGDRIGAAVKYNINPSFSIQVSVSAIESREPHFHRFVHDMLGH